MKHKGTPPTAVLLLVAYLLQQTVAVRIAFRGAHPDFLCVGATVAGLVWGPVFGFFVGALGGLFADLANGRFFGLLMLSRGAVGVLSGAITRQVFKENMLMTSTVCFALSCFADTLVGLILAMNGIPIDPAIYTPMVLSKALLNMAFTPFVFTPVYKNKVRIDSRDSTVLVE